MKKFIFAVIILFLMPSYLLAATITTDSTDNAGSARSLGMGRAYVAVSDDADAVFINQAGLAGLKVLNITGMYYSKVLGSYYYVTGSGAMPTDYGTIGLGFIGSGSSDLTDTRDPLNPKSFSQYDNAVVVAYGSPLSRFWEGIRRVFIGGSLKFFTRGYTGSVSDSGTGMNMDLGVKYIPARWLSLGLFKHNILPGALGGGLYWDTGHEEEFTSPLKLGAAVRLFENRQVIALDINSPSHPSHPSTMHFGTEYKATENLSFRAGLDQIIDSVSESNTTWNMALGLGISYAGFKFDYAYHPYFDDSENVTHYISMSYVGDIDLIKTKFASVSPDFGVLKSLPGRIYDDLGNVVAYEPTYLASNKEPKLDSCYSIIPIAAEIPDYGELYWAYVFSDIRAAKKEREPSRYWPGDIMPIITSAPLDIETITAIMPNGDEVKMTFDEKAGVWHGVWKIPRDMRPGKYFAKTVAIDFEGYKIEAKTTPFIIEGVAKEEEVVPKPEEKVEIEEKPEVMEPVVVEEEEVVVEEEEIVVEEEVPPSPELEVGGPEEILPIPVEEIEEKPEEEIFEIVEWQQVLHLAEKYLGKALSPYQKLSRSELVYVVARAKSYNLKEKVKALPFKDIPLDYWAASAISKCVKHGIVIGYPDKTFKGDNMVSLAELVVIISNMEFLKKNFKKDVAVRAPGEHWAMPSVRLALLAGILKPGEEPSFGALKSKPGLRKISDLLSRAETMKKVLKK